MAYVMVEPCIGLKDTACVDACPVGEKQRLPLMTGSGRPSPCTVLALRAQVDKTEPHYVDDVVHTLVNELVLPRVVTLCNIPRKFPRSILPRAVCT